MKTMSRAKKITKTIQLSDILIPKFQVLVNDKYHTHQIMTSGRAGTKSSAMAIIANYLMISEPSTAIVIMRKHHNKLQKTVYRECLRAIMRLGLNKNDRKMFKITRSPMQITYLPNGNTIYFTGSDSIDDTKGIIDEERTIKMVVLDELTEFFDKGDGEDEIMNIEATFVRGNNDRFTMLYLYNPPKNPKAPINEWCNKMEQRDDCVHIHASYLDVPVDWIGKKLVNEADAMKAVDYKMYRWVWLGEAVGIDDVVYYMFDPANHVKKLSNEELQKLQFITIGVDYGQMNATTFQAFGVDMINKKIVGIGEYYHSGRESGYQKSPSEYAKEFKEFTDKIQDMVSNSSDKTKTKKAIFVCIDPSAKGLAEEIKRLCPNVSIKDANNTVLLGINRCQKLLSHRVVFFNETQKHLQEEMYLYMWNMDMVDKGREEVIKQYDHCMDAFRYAVMGMWTYVKRMLPFIAGKDD